MAGGRPKGSKNKIPRDLAAKCVYVAEQLEAKGKGLLTEAESDPQWFYTNFIKPMLPKNYVFEDLNALEKMTDEQLRSELVGLLAAEKSNSDKDGVGETTRH